MSRLSRAPRKPPSLWTLALVLTSTLASCSSSDDSGGSQTGTGESDVSTDVTSSRDVKFPEPDATPGAGNDTIYTTDAPDTAGSETSVGSEIGEQVCGTFGDPCTANADCCDGFCVEGVDGGLQCTVGCVDECPDGFSCVVNVAAAPDVQLVCVPKVQKLCRECKADLQCNGGACITIGGGQFCTTDCSQVSCPSGYTCAELETGALGCLPDNGSCDCNVNNAGGLRPCSIENEYGNCNGLETCDPEAGWGACDARVPATEECNGIDDDCDGFVDEDQKQPKPCEAVVEGVGTCSGIATCQGSKGWFCSADTPYAETCDFIDNDCDNVVDEDFKDDNGKYVALNHCGKCNFNCEGLFPNAISRCDANKPKPTCVVDSCEPGFYKANEVQCLPEYDTFCQPCSDDVECGGGICVRVGQAGFCAEKCGGGNPCPSGTLCQAATDKNGAPKGQACLPQSGDCSCTVATQGIKRPCSTDSTIGTCFGFETCEATGGWSDCDADAASDELCNGKDDDCNGIIDDGLPFTEPCENSVAGIGTCSGDALCQGELGWVCLASKPIAELCDFKDNDCDGDVDESFKNAAGKYDKDGHCGTCNSACAGSIPNATASCNDGYTTPVCGIDACEAGFYKLNDFLCLVEGSIDCRPCTGDSQCEGRDCVEIGGSSHCASDCTTDTDCTSGYTCESILDPDTGANGSFCVPSNGTCDCTIQNSGAKRPCESTSPAGTCVGFEFCDPTAGWGACSAKPAAVETCSGIDEDCNGIIDDGVPQTQPCQVQNGFGTCSGTATCIGAAGYVCNAATPSAEACDFTDNDCDGTADEDFKNAAGKYATSGNCGSCGVACGGTIDNSAAETCNPSKSTPLCTVSTCKDGFFKLNDFQCIVPPDVSCVACKANADCFGGSCRPLTDGSFCADACDDTGDCEQGFVCDAGACIPSSGSCDCTFATAGVKRLCSNENDIGICVGLSVCSPESGWGPCDAGTPAGEICNGLDDDCNGIVDDGFPASTPCQKSNGFGVCTGESVCLGGLGQVCKAPDPAGETCNFVDDDCDGTVDDGFTDAQGRYVSDDHCGACNKSCGSTVSNSASEKCDAAKAIPQCVATSCAPGFFLLNEVQCVQNQAIQCSPCAVDDTCFGGKCTTVGSAKYCLDACTVEADCDEGYSCQNSLCRPDIGSCDCTPATAGKLRTCDSTNALGKCLGFETCDAVAGWGGCTASVPEVERCDGVDNECNGLVDDGLPPTQTCFKKNVFGQCNGISICFGAAGWVCQADEPAGELCDFKNNDCDKDSAGISLVDEDFRDENGRYTTQSHCGTCNNACGNQYANSATEVCDPTKPVPQCIIDTCDPGYIKLNDFQCILVPDVACEPCSSNANCFGETCVAVDGGNFCLEGCGAGKPPCEAGYSCFNGLCRPANGTCDCSADTNGKKRTCFETNSLGTCFGFETCEVASGWDDCDAIPPSQEVCNGVDDDCNGFIDDGLPASIPCQSTPNAFGTCSGTAVCFGTVGWYCTAPIASAEVCDYKDNDCDALVDEGYVNAVGKYGSQEHCGECGESCDDAILNASASCDANRPVPQCIVESCDIGWEEFNEFLCIPITASLCEPCATDANCIGAGSRCIPLNDGPRCGIACDDDLDCGSGFQCIDVGIGAKQCVPETGSCDCDGTNLTLQQACNITYTPPGGGPTSTCFGTDYCTVGGWSGCQAPAEACNGVDDDCDGLADEAFKDGTGKYTSPQHCGKCNRNCASLTFPNAVGICDTALSEPNCTFACAPSFFDVNKNPGDGCECKKTSNTDFVDGIDQNCDGIDGDVALGVFVAKNGSDSNAGTRSAPKLTIGGGIAAAVSGTKRDVYVATGVYGESIVLSNGISVYGGYNADFGARDVVVYQTAIIGNQAEAGKLGAVNAVGITGAGEKTQFVGFTVFGAVNLAPGQSSYTIYVRNSTNRLVVKNNRIIAGSGGDGAPGSFGADGADGTNGGNGVKPSDQSTCPAGTKITNGGDGGARTCGGASTNGGKGGDGYCSSNGGGTNNANEPGQTGANGGGAGGNTGYDAFIGGAGFPCYGEDCSTCLVSSTQSNTGGYGADGAGGANGASGLGCAGAPGSVANGQWIAGGGGTGGAASSGAGGGGGGAGGGTRVCSCASFNGGTDAGATGGGGGGGGCAGGLGQGGTGGGGSFGIFLSWDSTPTSIPDVSANAVQRANGGRGGVGGNGGVGGLAGKGGYGGPDGTSTDKTWCSGAGGAGGKGGTGGHGGGGGGGCGGAAYSIYAAGQGSANLAAIKSGNSVLPGGAGGAGGQGGLSLGTSGTKGSDGAFDFANF